MQTILGHVLPSRGARRRRAAGHAHREVRLDDGDRLLVFEEPGSNGVRVHLFHGLSGDVNADYMRRSASVLAARGYGVWSVNHRGCGEGRGLAARPYHSGRSEDLAAVLRASREDAPDAVHLLVGFSLSGNAALLLAAEGRAPLPDGLVAVNPPADLDRASTAIGRGWSRLYELRFLAYLRRAVRERERAGFTRGRYDIPRLATLREFDDLFTAPECGFADGRDYYRRCSTVERLAEIEVPTVVLTSGDDPFVDAAALAAAPRSSSVFLHVEPSGGHVGYLARPRSGLGWRRWLDDALAHYVAELAPA